MDPRLWRYHVVVFTTAPLIGRYACVPVSWVIYSNKDKVLVAYPEQDETITHLLVQNRISRQNDWKLYTAFIQCTTASYDDAIAFMSRLRDQSLRGCGVHTLHGPEAARRFQTGNPANQQGLRPIENNVKQPPLKRPSYTEDGDNIKRFRAAQTDVSMSNTSIHTCATQTTHVDARKNTSNVGNIKTASQKGSEIRPVHSENPQSPIQPSSSKTLSDHYISAGDINAYFISMKKQLEEDALIRNNLRKDIINRINMYNQRVKVINETTTLNYKLPYASIPKELTSAVKVEQTEDKAGSSSKADTMTKTERAPKFTLPSENKPEDPRWTLGHRNTAPVLVEIMPHSGIYIRSDSLAKYGFFLGTEPMNSARSL